MCKIRLCIIDCKIYITILDGYCTPATWRVFTVEDKTMTTVELIYSEIQCK